jgi:hypothetical protein
MSTKSIELPIEPGKFSSEQCFRVECMNCARLPGVPAFTIQRAYSVAHEHLDNFAGHQIVISPATLIFRKYL